MAKYIYFYLNNLAFTLLINLLSRAATKQQTENTCNGSFNYADRKYHESFPKLLTNWTLIEQLYGDQEYRFKVESGQIFYINAPNPEQQFVMCLTPKSGSTQYKLLLYKILHQDFDMSNVKNTKSIEGQWSAYNPLQHLKQKQVEQVLKNKDIPRFQIVRNPYIRAISMYESKLQGMKPVSKFFKKGLNFPEDEDITFEQFVERVYDIFREPSSNHQGYNYINKHFQPQSKLCKIHLGMSYNYYLKMDEMNDWYNCFVDKLQIQDVVSSGWPGKNNCYFSTTEKPCNGPSHQEPALSNKKRLEFSSVSSDLDRIYNYYQNSTIIQMVNLIYADDFFTYDYEMMLD